jgi:cytochrome c peroxidase
MTSLIRTTRRLMGAAALLPIAAVLLAFTDSTPPPIPEAYMQEIVTPPTTWSAARAALGRRLFFDTVLSHDRSISCATCHDPDRAFTDGKVVAEGIGAQHGNRNTPTIVNRALGLTQFWDGRAQTLEAQALGPIANPQEMGLPVEQAVARLAADPSYEAAFRRAFGGGPDATRLAQALAAYERTVYSVDSPFDRFIAGDESALSEPARRGLAVFGGKARCGECHTGPNFSDEAFYSLGVGPDAGRQAVTALLRDHGAFKTPTLREIARTGPYMHDGSIATLADVVEYYDKGCAPHPNLPAKIQPLRLTAQEKADLVAFLESLSGRVVDVAAAEKE